MRLPTRCQQCLPQLCQPKCLQILPPGNQVTASCQMQLTMKRHVPQTTASRDETWQWAFSKGNTLSNIYYVTPPWLSCTRLGLESFFIIPCNLDLPAPSSWDQLPKHLFSMPGMVLGTACTQVHWLTACSGGPQGLFLGQYARVREMPAPSKWGNTGTPRLQFGSWKFLILFSNFMLLKNL